MSYAHARAVFAEYAGVDAPALPEDRWSAAQVRHARWQVEQFGVVPPWASVLGIVEEVCDELLGALDDSLAVEDACADAMIFATGLATSCRIDFGTVVKEARDFSDAWYMGTSEKILARACGQLARAALKHSQGIRGMNVEAFREAVYHGLVILVCELDCCAKWRGFDLGETYFATLDRVLARDWRERPDVG